ncbi:hypothetical protein ABI59_13610 [Acidobacteria bacterium Mor1]|nr:hypothetical protein ABI59_13610 [Acidobacteria bacterium Mor1]
MTLSVVLAVAALAVAYANGANDNFKGVATLYGSGTVGYRGALAWATVTTLAGSLASVFLAGKLVKAFSGKGLVPDGLAASPEFLAAVAVGAAGTLWFATLRGFPISTTHALIGGMVGAGLAGAPSELAGGRLLQVFLIPLLVSPLIAALAGGFLALRVRRLGVAPRERLCLCVGDTARPLLQPRLGVSMAAVQAPAFDVATGTYEQCEERFPAKAARFDLARLRDGAHFLSAGAVSFARGLNDTPKIVGLLVALQALRVEVSLLAVALVMALGGVLQARKVAETVGRRITGMDHTQGLTSNAVTAFLVIVASRFGVPVSTTHVSCGALFGLGTANGQGRFAVMRQILLAWVVTLPVSALLAASAFAILG